MIVDGQLLFSDAQQLTVEAGSTNTIDTRAANQDWGTGEALYVVVTIDVALADDSSNSTLTVTLQGDSTTTITPDHSVVLGTIPATSAAGAVFIYRLDPAATPLLDRYLRLLYTPNNGDLSAGTVTALITHNVQRYLAHADNVTITG